MIMENQAQTLLFFKMVLIQHLYGLPSLRRTDDGGILKYCIPPVLGLQINR